MRTIVASTLVLAAACSAPGIPVSTAPRHETRVDIHSSVLALATNSRTQATRDLVPGAPAAIWPELQRTYNELGIGVAELNHEAYVIGNSALSVAQRLAGERLSKWVDCGRTATGVPAADRYPVSLQIFTQLVPTSDGGSEARTLITGTAANPTSNDAVMRCVSTGQLELRIVAGLAVAAG